MYFKLRLGVAVAYASTTQTPYSFDLILSQNENVKALTKKDLNFQHSTV